MASGDNEKLMAALLRRGLREAAEPSAGSCPEPGVLAAYFERELDSGETAHWETHFARCDHCQQQLAALARMEPEAAVAEQEHAAAPSLLEQGQPALAARPVMAAPASQGAKGPERLRFWRARWPWVTAVAAGLSAAALWLTIQSRAPRPAALVSRSQAPQVPLVAAPEKRTITAQTNAQRIESTAPRQHTAPATHGAPALPAAPTHRAKAARKTPHGEIFAPATTGAAVGVTAAGELSAGLTKSQPLETAQKSEEKGNVQGMQALYPAKALPAPVPPASAMRAAPRAKLMAPQVSTSAAPPISTASGELVQNPDFKSRSTEVTVPSPDPNVMWRISAAGTIEHTRDGGKTWKGQFLEPGGAEMVLVAGSAPSEKICWLVGNAGTVLRTTDGEKWIKIAFPVSDNLVKVEAESAQTATVATASGKTYTTQDGGRTWQPKESE